MKALFLVIFNLERLFFKEYTKISKKRFKIDDCFKR